MNGNKITKLANSSINRYSITNSENGVLQLCSIITKDNTRYSMVVSRMNSGYVASEYYETLRLQVTHHTSLKSVKNELRKFIQYVTY